MAFTAIGAAAIGAAGTIYASEKSAGAQKKAAQTASDTQLQQYYQNREDLAPWRETGGNALAQIANLSGANGTDAMQNALGSFQASPGYEFRVAEGQRGIENTAAARGLLLSGSALKGIEDYRQNAASDEYSNYYNRLASLAGIGQTATNTTAQLGSTTANSLANIAMQNGQNQASMYQQQGAAVNNFAGNALTGYLAFGQPSATSANSAVGYIQRNPSSAWNLGAAP
ncbi:hypothetical protein QMO56_25020 [Roseomonas sp. E05]|uniref:hypothetical protein n=1 Tax=Roseomonas sp. E05 TaxID=3046310 RepID=UPI0024B8A9DB|nr:hypothetical protein [Roseomonas sp. E05]MDJ0391374.1 hypothetical protein [Roseomonas sp. E05]